MHAIMQLPHITFDLVYTSYYYLLETIYHISGNFQTRISRHTAYKYSSADLNQRSSDLNQK